MATPPETIVTAPTRPTQPPLLAFHPYRMVIAAGTLMALGALSLAFVSGPGARRGAMALDALPALLLLLPAFAGAMVPDHTRPPERVHALVGAGFTLVAVPYALVKLLDASILAESLGGSMAAGPWLLLVGAIVVAVGLALTLLRPHAAPVTLRADRGRSEAPRQHRGTGSPTRRAPSRLTENPFGEPLFDSLEVVVPPQSAVEPEAEEAPTSGAARPDIIVFDAENAVPRRADDETAIET